MHQSDDPLNTLFMSSQIEDLLTFYDSFDDREGLIAWMSERRKSNPSIIEVDGDHTGVVVIPTADYKSSRTQTCSLQIYRGMQQIIVESIRPKDVFFNYSHNVNLGISKAMEFNPKWIIISNDDMVPIDPPNVLLNELKKFEQDKFNVLYTKEKGLYHSFPRFIGTPNSLYSFIAATHPNRLRKKRLDIWRKFDLKYIDAIELGLTGLLSRLTYARVKKHLLTGSFTILSKNYVGSIGEVYDETFINGGEDTDLSLKLSIEPVRAGFINYKIGDFVGTSLGSGWTRYMRNIVNEIYLSYKIEKGLIRVD